MWFDEGFGAMQSMVVFLMCWKSMTDVNKVKGIEEKVQVIFEALGEEFV